MWELLFAAPGRQNIVFRTLIKNNLTFSTFSTVRDCN